MTVSGCVSSDADATSDAGGDCHDDAIVMLGVGHVETIGDDDVTVMSG